MENVKISVHWEILNFKMGNQIGEKIVLIVWHVFVDVQKRLLNMVNIVRIYQGILVLNKNIKSILLFH